MSSVSSTIWSTKNIIYSLFCLNLNTFYVYFHYFFYIIPSFKLVFPFSLFLVRWFFYYTRLSAEMGAYFFYDFLLILVSIYIQNIPQLILISKIKTKTEAFIEFNKSVKSLKRKKKEKTKIWKEWLKKQQNAGGLYDAKIVSKSWFRMFNSEMLMANATGCIDIHFKHQKIIRNEN